MKSYIKFYELLGGGAIPLSLTIENLFIYLFLSIFMVGVFIGAASSSFIPVDSLFVFIFSFEFALTLNSYILPFILEELIFFSKSSYFLRKISLKKCSSLRKFLRYVIKIIS